MEQTSTTSSTPTMQPDQFTSSAAKLQLPHFMNTELIQYMRSSSSQNLPTLQNFASNSRTQNQFSSSHSLTNQNGSSTSIPATHNNSNPTSNSSNGALNQIATGNSIAQIAPISTNSPANMNSLASPTLPNSNNNNTLNTNNSNNGTGSPTKITSANNLLGQLPLPNINTAPNNQIPLHFLSNPNFLQFQLQQLQNQQQLNAMSQPSGILGLTLPGASQTQQQQQQQQQQMFFLNMMENMQQQQQQQQQQQMQMEQLNNLGNLHMMAAQLQTLPNMKMPSCLKHQHKSESVLKYVCAAPTCSQQWQLFCQNCMQEHAGHEILDVRVFMSQIKGKITENITATSAQFNTIENLFNTNIQGLEGMQEHINNLLDTLRSLQRAYFMMKLTSNNDTTYLLNILKEIEEPQSCLTEKQLNERISSISKISQNIRQVKMDSFSQLININNMAAKTVLDTKQQIMHTQNLAVNLQETFSHRMIGSEMKELEKKHQEEKTLEHFSKLFHLIKGHAKKRDVINFLTWEPQTKELKYSKDIKDKHGEHFYVSFSLKLKNIENMENKDIDENFISKIVKVVEEKAPEIQNKKNAERKKIDPNGKKRKYCRFNPRIEIDVSLNCSAYKNIKIE